MSAVTGGCCVSGLSLRLSFVVQGLFGIRVGIGAMPYKVPVLELCKLTAPKWLATRC